MEHSLAKKIVDSLVNSANEYDGLILEIKENCTEDEFKFYRMGFARTMAEMLDGVLNPIFKEHPDLKPEGLDQKHCFSRL